MVRQEHGDVIVAANQFVDPDNASWEALRESAKRAYSPDQEMPTFLLLELSPEDGAIRVLQDVDAGRLVETSPGNEVFAAPPKTFMGEKMAAAWIRLFGKRGFKYLLVEAREDYEADPNLDPDYSPNNKQLQVFLRSAGFELISNENARGWWNGAGLIEQSVLEGKTYRQVAELMGLSS